ncbi:hypothetical protein NL489_30295, partial [Klebsiella pneumoniae]|nr:hypothetical protein [Klebsiella pneumoniae]
TKTAKLDAFLKYVPDDLFKYINTKMSSSPAASGTGSPIKSKNPDYKYPLTEKTSKMYYTGEREHFSFCSFVSLDDTRV